MERESPRARHRPAERSWLPPGIEGVVHIHPRIVPAVTGEDFHRRGVSAFRPFVFGKEPLDPVVYLRTQQDVFGTRGAVNGTNGLCAVLFQRLMLFFGDFDHGYLFSLDDTTLSFLLL